MDKQISETAKELFSRWKKEEMFKVLEKLAKEYKIEKNEEKRTWDEIPRNYCFCKEQVKKAVEIAIDETRHNWAI